MGIRRFTADADATITNAFGSALTETSRGTGSNMGASDILETFQIYGQESTASSELSRILIQFPVDSIASDRADGTLPASGSVAFYLKMYNAEHSKTTPSNFTMAVNRRSREEEPDWFNLEIWGKQAQIAADYVKKGSLIGITGSFKIDSWKDKNTGEDRYKPVVRVDRLNLLSSRKESDNNQYSNNSNSSEIPF